MPSSPAWLAVLLVLFAGAARAADFPDPARLPARPELPDPLVMLNGDKVTTKEQWLAKRRPELKELFQHYMYGYLPPVPAKVSAQVTLTDPKFFDGKATLKLVTLTYGPPEWPKIHLLVVVPNERKGPAPVFVGMNFAGNHAVLKDPRIPLTTAWMYGNYPGVKDNRATEASRGTQVDTWALDQAVERGYAVATFYSGDVAPDRKDSLEGSIRQFFLKKGEAVGNEWGTIAAWAWGIQRAVDYLVTDKDLDAKRIAVVGHSRLGKTALLCAAFDERIALAIPHQAGCGGTAPSRTTSAKAETVKAINAGFPHWFDDNFKKFNDDVDRLPFDQHCLAALVAPRPLLYTNAVEDRWANPDGQFEMLKAAEPVYRLLGAGGLDAKAMPEPGKLIDSTLGYYIREGKHSMTREDWKVFLDFADKQLGKPGAK
jgi:hypothetical protein